MSLKHFNMPGFWVAQKLSCMHEHPSVSPSTMPKVSGTCFPWLCKSADLENDVRYCQQKTVSKQIERHIFDQHVFEVFPSYYWSTNDIFGDDMICLGSYCIWTCSGVVFFHTIFGLRLSKLEKSGECYCVTVCFSWQVISPVKNLLLGIKQKKNSLLASKIWYLMVKNPVNIWSRIETTATSI